MTQEAVAYAVLDFWWGFVSALWLHDPIERWIHRRVDREMRRRNGK